MKNKMVILLILIFFVSNINVTNAEIFKREYTVDDVRDIVGAERVDEQFNAKEIEEIINKYQAIERLNLYAKMFQLGKEIDIDSEAEKMHQKYRNEIELIQIELERAYKKGEPINKVLEIKTRLESKIHEKNKLKETGIEFEFEFIENRWSEKYEKVQQTVEEMAEDYVIGDLGGNLRSPVHSRFDISSPYGFRVHPVTKDALSFHSGIDLKGDEGTPLLSLWNGIVSNIYVSETGGRSIEISHGKDLKTYYLHLSKIHVEIGQEVSQYKVIGEVGNTGRSTGPHLHLGIKLDGEYINPLYVFGNRGLNAFKEYLSYNPKRNKELIEIEKTLKDRPDKLREIEKIKISKYYREEELKEGQIETNLSMSIEPTPYTYENNGLFGANEDLRKYIDEVVNKDKTTEEEKPIDSSQLE